MIRQQLPQCMANNCCGLTFGLLCFIIWYPLTHVLSQALAQILCTGKVFNTIKVPYISENIISPIFLVCLSSIIWAMIIYKTGIKFTDMYSAKSGRDGSQMGWDGSYGLDMSINDPKYVELSGGFHDRDRNQSNYI